MFRQDWLEALQQERLIQAEVRIGPQAWPVSLYAKSCSATAITMSAGWRSCADLL
jgi:hypothetical protein